MLLSLSCAFLFAQNDAPAERRFQIGIAFATGETQVKSDLLQTSPLNGRGEVAYGITVATHTDYLLQQRLDGGLEIGFQEELARGYYRLGILYGESLGPFTRVGTRKLYSQTLRIKLEVGIRT